jgi:hypothetical protein
MSLTGHEKRRREMYIPGCCVRGGVGEEEEELVAG